MVQDYLQVDTSSGAAKTTRGKRPRGDLSKIGVANYDLDTVIKTVGAIRASGLERGTMKALADKAFTPEKFSTFATKVYAAAKYRLLDVQETRPNDPREIVLLDLSKRILDPQTERQAKVEAFLNVPLHRAIYARFQGQSLADDNEINRIMHDDLGVSGGVVNTARQVMRRAARQAGMFDRFQDQMTIPDGVSLPETHETIHKSNGNEQEEIPMVTPPPALSPSVPPSSLNSMQPDVRRQENMDSIIDVVLKQRPAFDGMSSEDEFDAWHRWFDSTIEYVKVRARGRR